MSQLLFKQDVVVQAALANIRNAGRLIFAALQEIFDESAYDRFLIRRQLATSPNAYAAFREEQEMAKARRPRCC
jgi:hypothetical protein